MLTRNVTPPGLTVEEQKECIAEIQRTNDQYCWELMLKQFSPAILRFSTRKLEPRDVPGEVESEILLRFINAVRGYDPTVGVYPSTYIIRALQFPVNRAAIRGPVKVSMQSWKHCPHHYKTATAPPMPEICIENTTQGVYSTNPLEKLERSEMKYLLNRAINALPANCVYVIRGRLQGKTYREIGDELDISRQRARDLYKRAIELLRELLASKQDDLI